MVTSTTLQPIKDGILLEIKVSFGAGKFEGFTMHLVVPNKQCV